MKTKILRPSKLKLLTKDAFAASKSRLSANNFTYYGTQYAKDYDLTITKPSQKVQESGELFFQMETERPPGSLHETKSFYAGKNLYPSYFTKPFEYRYSDVDPRNEYGPTGGLNWIGQNNYNVKTYKPFGMAGSDSKTLAFPFMFEHNCELYLLAESRKKIANTERNSVSLYKRIGDNFSEVYDFREVPVDTNNYTDAGLGTISPITSVQIGSATAVSVDGHIYIAYRYYDRAELCSWIIIYKGNDFGFTEKTRVRIKGAVTNSTYVDYRLRIAYGDGVFMLVSYGVGSYVLGQQEVQSDFRTLISYDFCDSFEGRTVATAGVLDSLEIEQRAELTESLFSINSGINGVDNYSTLFRGNARFSLHYDKTISSFVLFKGGNPDLSLTAIALSQESAYNTYTRADHLIGIIAPVSKPFDWNLAARYRLNRQNIALGDYENIGIDFDIDSYRDTEEGIYISDICAISNGIEHFLLITSHGQLKDFGNSLTKIAFIDSRYMPRSSISGSIAFGQKVHKDYVFMTDPLTTHASGFAHGGSNVLLKQSDQLLKTPVRWKDPIGCFWRNQIAMSLRLTETATNDTVADGGFAELYSDIFNEYTCLAIAGEHSNLAETFGYEFSYPRKLKNPYGFNMVYSGAGDNFFSEEKDIFVFTDGPSYMSLSNATEYSSIANRIRLQRIPKFKTRFQASFHELDSTAEVHFLEYKITSFIDAGIGSTDKYAIFLDLYYYGDGSVKMGRNAPEQTMAIFEQDQIYDIAIIVETAMSSEDEIKTYFAYKKLEEEKWNLVEFIPNVLKLSSLSLNFINYGMIDISSGDELSLVGIGDIHISSYSSGYKQQLQEYEFETTITESVYQSSTVRYTRCRAATSYSKKLNIFEGTATMSGFRDKGYRANKFSLEGIRQRNSIKNIVSDSTDLVYKINSQDATQEVLFEISDMSGIDTLAFLNCAGILGVEIISGIYNEQTGLWSNEVSNYYNWPKKALQRLSVEDRTLIVEDDLASHELFYSYLQVESAGEIVAQVKVIDNLDAFIFVEDQAQIVSDTRIIYKADKNAIFQFDSIPSKHTHIKILIDLIQDSEAYIGKIAAGTLINLSDSLTEVEQKIYSYDKMLTSNTGYSFSSNSEVISIADILSIKLPKMTIDEPYFNRNLSLINNYYKQKEAVTIYQIYEDESYSKIYHGPITEISLTPNGREADLSFGVSSVNNISNPTDYYAADWQVGFACPAICVAGESVDFSAYLDNEAGIVASYTWDFGDGSTASGQVVSNTYGNSGIYTVSLTSTDQYGRQETYTRLLNVSENRISDYVLTSSGGPTLFTITISAKDRLSATVDDDSTILYIEAPSLTVSTLKLTSGSVSFDVTSTPSSELRVVFIDSLGKTWTKRIVL